MWSCRRCKAPFDAYGARTCDCETCTDCLKVFEAGTLAVAPTDEMAAEYGDDGRCAPCWKRITARHEHAAKLATRRARKSA